MSTEQYSPYSTVPISGVYYCVMCRLSSDLAKAKGADPFLISTLYAKEMGIDAEIIKDFYACKEAVFRKNFKALDNFDECPIHKTATGWLLEEEESVCDTCTKKIGKLDGYLLSTKEVVLSIASWKRFLLNSGAVIQNLLKNPKAFIELVAIRASSDTPWQICEECAGMFSFDHDFAKAELLRNRATGEPSKGFGLCYLLYHGGSLIDPKDATVEILDEENFNAALKSARMALDQIVVEKGSKKSQFSDSERKRKWWKVRK